LAAVRNWWTLEGPGPAPDTRYRSLKQGHTSLWSALTDGNRMPPYNQQAVTWVLIQRA